MGIELTIEVYRLGKKFPPIERYGLLKQTLRAAASVPANIAEGHGRIHRGDYHHHISMARGSLMELDTHLEIAKRLGYVNDADLTESAEKIDHLGRMLTTLSARLKSFSMADGRWPSAKASTPLRHGASTSNPENPDDSENP
jgi:four helix bundle protein